MKASLVWLLTMIAGFGAMLYSYYGMQTPQREAIRSQAAAPKPPTGKSSHDNSTPRAKAIASWTNPAMRVPSLAFHVYLGGMALFLLGGSGLFIRLFEYLSTVRRLRGFRLPMIETRRYRRLFIGAHLLCFGTALLFMELAFFAPETQREFMGMVSRVATHGRGLLRPAIAAYFAKDVLMAMLITVVNNFFLASVLTAMLPSLLVPGIGPLIMWLRFIFVGVLLSPTHVALSSSMLPHSVTLLLEGEAYVMVCLFATLVPVYSFGKSEGPTFGRRYLRSIILNVKGSVWILMLLVVAGAYEAVEVIAQIP